MKYLVSFFFLFITFFGLSQQIEYVDFKLVKSDIEFGDLMKNEVKGIITSQFYILKDVDSIFIDAKKMTFENVIMHELGVPKEVEFTNVKYRNDSNRLIIYNEFKREGVYELKFNYSAQPQKSLYFIDWKYKNGNKQIWTQGQGKYTSNWLPSIDDMNDKIEFDVSITFDKDYEVIANGKLTTKLVGESITTWHYDMQKPMSSYLVALAIGKYNKKVAYSKSGISLDMYYYPKDSLKFEPTYRYTKQMFDFLEEEIGVPYPWQNYKQVPVKDFLYAGMENTGTTIFSDAFVVDSIAFGDKNYVNVNAHELAHQWFGNLVTEISGTHHWLQEGFATYYALLAEKELFGDDYYYWRLYEYAQELVSQDKAGKSTSLLDPKSSSITFYKKGAWTLHLLREKVGDEAFIRAVKNYLKKHEFKNVETDDFISEVEEASGEDLNNFVKDWLETKNFNHDGAIESLKKSVFIQEYLLIDCEADNLKCKDYLLSAISDQAKTKVVSQISNIIKNEYFKNSLKVRQAIAQSVFDISEELKGNYETLLDDKSYITIENALLNLWQNFPQERIKYLNKTKGVQGFNNKNIRILWLALALITEDFESENKTRYFQELTDYTSDKYGFEVRINAFRYLKNIRACNEACIDNLKQATVHHNWQFSKFAKELLKAE